MQFNKNERLNLLKYASYVIVNQENYVVLSRVPAGASDREQMMCSQSKKKRPCFHSTGLCLSAATSNFTPASISSVSSTSTGE